MIKFPPMRTTTSAKEPHLNESLNANFDLDQFEHTATYNNQLGCIQMFLRSLTDQQVQVADTKVSFAKDELIHTENSFKYTPAEVEALCTKVGFSLSMHFEDIQQYFSLYVFEGS